MRIVLVLLLLAAPLHAQTHFIVAAGPGGGGPGGGVSSVDVTAPAELSVTGAPITTSGTIALAWASQTQNLIFGAPCASNGSPLFRSLCAADIPALAPSKITGTAVVTADARLSDARTPTAHASTHAAAGGDPVTLAQSQVTNLATDLAGKQATDSDLTDLASAGSSGTGAFMRATATQPIDSDLTALATDGSTGTGAFVRATGNAATATALAANPSDCSAGQFANAIAASGNLTCGPELGDSTTTTAQTITAEKTFTVQPVMPLMYRQTGWLTVPNITATAFAAVGVAAAGASGTLSAYSDATGTYISTATTATSANTVNHRLTGLFATQARPDVSITFKTGTDIANIRYILGCGDGSNPLMGGTDDMTGLNVIALCYSTAADGTAFWRTCTNDGSGAGTRTATAVAIAADSRYTFRFACDSATACRVFMNSVLVSTITTDLPTPSATLGCYMQVTTLENLSKSLRNGVMFVIRD